MPHLRSIGRKPSSRDDDGFPFTVAAVRTLPTLPFSPTVTLFVGENGSGKSTVLEAIAAAAGLPTVAYPEAVIYSFDQQPVAAVAYDDLDHVRLTRDFLGDPQRFLRQLDV